METVTQRAVLHGTDLQRLELAKENYENALEQVAIYREVVAEMVSKSSFREVSKLTGLSTNTLQRWKREAGK